MNMTIFIQKYKTVTETMPRTNNSNRDTLAAIWAELHKSVPQAHVCASNKDIFPYTQSSTVTPSRDAEPHPRETSSTSPKKGTFTA